MRRATFQINFVGDLCLMEIDTQKCRVHNDIRSLLERGDINVANLETPLTLAEEGAPDRPVHMKANPEPNPILDLFDTYSLGNNHVLDYGRRGIEDTIAFLSEQGKLWFGGGPDEEQACEPLRIERNGLRVAFVAYTRWDNARRRHAGATPMNMRRLAKTIRVLKKEGRFVVVYAHWNYEHIEYPAPVERKRAKGLIDAGADLIAGAHPHIVQGFEVYRGKHIFHSLGNFLFYAFESGKRDKRLSETFVLSVDVEPSHDYQVTITPVHTHDGGIEPMAGASEEEFRKKLDRLSRVFEDEKLYKEQFYSHAKELLGKKVKMLRSASKRRSALGGLVRRLSRLQRQHLYIAWHAWFGK